MTQTSPDPAAEALFAQLRDCLRQAAVEMMFAENEEALLEDDGEAAVFLLALAAEATILAWSMLLVQDARIHGNMTVTAERLDDAMLPSNVTDDEIVGMSGGLGPAPLVRSTLRKLKLLLPPGKVLPDPIIEMLAEEGIAVH